MAGSEKIFLDPDLNCFSVGGAPPRWAGPGILTTPAGWWGSRVPLGAPPFHDSIAQRGGEMTPWWRAFFFFYGIFPPPSLSGDPLTSTGHVPSHSPRICTLGMSLERSWGRHPVDGGRV